MNEDRLENVLREADRRAGSPTAPEDLADRARMRAARRRGRTAGGWSAAAAVILAGLGFWKLNVGEVSPIEFEGSLVISRGIDDEGTPAPAIVPAANRPAAIVLAEIERMNREAAFQSALVREIRSAERIEPRNERTVTIATPDPTEEARRQADEAAFAMVAHADRMCRKLHQCESAAERYRWVTEYFPESCWATVARQRLDEMKQKGEIS